MRVQSELSVMAVMGAMEETPPFRVVLVMLRPMAAMVGMAAVPQVAWLATVGMAGLAAPVALALRVPLSLQMATMALPLGWAVPVARAVTPLRGSPVTAVMVEMAVAVELEVLAIRRRMQV